MGGEEVMEGRGGEGEGMEGRGSLVPRPVSQQRMDYITAT